VIVVYEKKSPAIFRYRAGVSGGKGVVFAACGIA
jgi:hypothetical protein